VKCVTIAPGYMIIQRPALVTAEAFVSSRGCPVVGSCRANEPSDSVTGGDFLGHESDC
jgi:hypothetical protein